MIDEFLFEHEIIKESDSSFEKCRVAGTTIVSVLTVLKNDPLYDYNRLNTIIAVDLAENVELIYDLESTFLNKILRISVLLPRNNPSTCSIVEVYKSAHYDECEIFDMFGVRFEGNKDLKRLLMPKGWIGYPLRKDYVFDDKRLSWSVDERK